MATTINPSRSVRFLELKGSPQKLNPGPGRYDPGSTLTRDGSYFVSKFHSSMCRTHYHSNRQTQLSNKSETPGPGNYRMPSDFGYYDGRKDHGAGDNGMGHGMQTSQS